MIPDITIGGVMLTEAEAAAVVQAVWHEVQRDMLELECHEALKKAHDIITAFEKFKEVAA
jgi:hypothetical protein